MNPVHTALTEYLDGRRALGGKVSTVGMTLSQCVPFAEHEGATFLPTARALRWATQPQGPHPAHGATRLGMVRRLAQYGHALDLRTEMPPPGWLPYRYRRQPPSIYSAQEITPLVDVAQQLRSATGLRSCPYATLFGLLAVTGMRLSEARHLDRADVDLPPGSRTIRHTKLGKTRWLPLHASTPHVLQQ